MSGISVFAFTIGGGMGGGPIALVIGLIAIAIVVAFAREFGRGTKDSSTRLLRGIRKHRRNRKARSHQIK